MPAHIQSNRPLSSVSSPSSSTAAGGGGAAGTPIDHDQMDENSSSQLNLTKVFMNRSFTLRRQHANHLPTPTKSSPSIPNQGQALMAPSQQPPLRPAARQPLKPTASVPAPTSLITSNGQTNRAVELRRARAQAKIEELSQRTRKQLHKSDHQNDIMSASWHSNATSSNKKDPTNVRSNPRMSVKTNRSSQVQDMSKLSSPSHQRSSSTSPKPFGEATPQYRRAMVSSVIDEQQYRRMNGSVYANETVSTPYSLLRRECVGFRLGSMRFLAQRRATTSDQTHSTFIWNTRKIEVRRAERLENDQRTSCAFTNV